MAEDLFPPGRSVPPDCKQDTLPFRRSVTHYDYARRTTALAVFHHHKRPDVGRQVPANSDAARVRALQSPAAFQPDSRIGLFCFSKTIRTADCRSTAPVAFARMALSFRVRAEHAAIASFTAQYLSTAGALDKNRQASVGMVSDVARPHSGHVILATTVLMSQSTRPAEASGGQRPSLARHRWTG